MWRLTFISKERMSTNRESVTSVEGLVSVIGHTRTAPSRYGTIARR